MGNHFAAEVHLEHDVYYPGNVVRGEATIKVDQPMKCIAARIMCRGLERAIVVRNTGEYVHSCSEDTVFFKETLTLFGHSTKDPETDPIEVPPGTYTYPFAFELPMHLPESCRVTNWSWGGAEIKYAVIAYAKLDKDTVDEGHHDFVVVAPVNQRDMLKSPAVEAAGVAKLHTLFLDKGTADINVKLTRSLFSADDSIEGQIVIDNTNGHKDVENPKLTVQAECDSHVHERCCGVSGGLRGGAMGEAIVHKKLIAKVAAGKAETIPFKLRLPHIMTMVSYPSRGINVNLRHTLAVEIAGKKVEVPIHIAHCCDDKNRFDFIPVDEVAHKPEHRDFEHGYAVPEGVVASVCDALKPPTGLPPQPAPTMRTPQATGNGQLHS